MPTYQYACTACDERLEVVQKFSDDPLTECPACQGRLRKLFSAVGVVFKGSGFYRTDSRAAANGTKGSGANGSDSSSGSGESAKSGSGESGKGSSSNDSTSGSSSSSSGESSSSPSGGSSGKSKVSTDSAA